MIANPDKEFPALARELVSFINRGTKGLYPFAMQPVSQPNVMIMLDR